MKKQSNLNEVLHTVTEKTGIDIIIFSTLSE